VLEMRGYEYSQTFPYFPFIDVATVLWWEHVDQLRIQCWVAHAIRAYARGPISEER